jgi:Replication initiation factor
MTRIIDGDAQLGFTERLDDDRSIERTPPTRRGVHFPAEGASPVGLGWLSITVRGRDELDRAHIARQLVDVLDADPRPRERGIKGYEHAVDLLAESALGWTDRRPNEVHLTLKQSDCTWQRLADVVACAEQFEEWHATRLDLNYDDVERRVEPDEVLAAGRRGDVVTRAARFSRTEDYRRGGLELASSVYIGSIDSDRRLNVYDKDLERAQALGQPVALGTYGVRWELRLRDDRATRTLLEICARTREVAELAAFFWRNVLDLVDFRTATAATGHHNESRERLPWFAQLVGPLERGQGYHPRPPEPANFRLWRLERWLRHQVASAIAELDELQPIGEHGGPGFVSQLVESGYRRLLQRRARASVAFLPAAI